MEQQGALEEKFRLKRFQFVLLFLFLALFAVQVVPRLSVDSPCGDEPIDVANGFYYWKGDVISDHRHPPFSVALQGLPLQFMSLKSHLPDGINGYESRDDFFCYRLNWDRIGEMLLAGRCVTLAFGLLLGLLLWKISGIFSPVVCLLTLALWVFEPNLQAYSSLVLTDIPFAVCFLAAVYSFHLLLEQPSQGKSALCGLLTGIALTCKFSGAILLVIYLLMEIEAYLKKPKDLTAQPNGPSFGSRWAMGLSVFTLWIFFIYLPGTFKLPGHPWPFRLFWDGFTAMANFSGHPVFFKGVVARQTYWDYYPTTFALKSTLPFLILLALAVGLALTRRIHIPLWQWMPPFLLFGAMIPFHQLGIREILAVYPFFILMAAQAGGWLWGQGGQFHPCRTALLVLVIFNIASVVENGPHPISYFNELIARDRKIYWLGDSNLDIGQDNQRLVLTARERNWTRVKLAYFGGPDPALYGLKWEPWTQKDLSGPQPGWVYAINAGFIQLGPAYLPDAAIIAKSWVSSLAPSGKVGDTWFYFEIPGQARTNDTSATLLSNLRMKYDLPPSP